MIKYLFLDLDDTILDFKKAEAIAIRKTMAAYGADPVNYATDLKHTEIGSVSCVIFNLTKLSGNNGITNGFDIGVGGVDKFHVLLYLNAKLFIFIEVLPYIGMKFVK